VADELLVHCL